MAGDKPRICTALTSPDTAVIRSVEPYTDLYEVRIDLIGEGWQDLVRGLGKPWLATNRRREEGGNWQGSEEERVRELLAALDLGVSIVDIELQSPSLGTVVEQVKDRAGCLVSCHDFEKTPPLDDLRGIVREMTDAGADICKVVTTARCFEDNLTVLRLLRKFPETNVVAFAMGEAGRLSRILAPLAGGYFTFASAAAGGESAPGQVTVEEMDELYRMLEL